MLLQTGLLLLIISLTRSQHYIDELLTVEDVFVGDKVTFNCDLSKIQSNTILPTWIVNETEYNLNRLPDDYNIDANKDDNVLSITIESAKLWMNNTRFACSSQYPVNTLAVGHLYVNFDFQGPEDQDITVGDSVQFMCKSPTLVRYKISTIWKINGISYNPLLLPSKFVQKEDLLYIPSVTLDLQGTSFQCFFYSNQLWKNKLYFSDIAILTVSASNFNRSIVKLKSPKFNTMYFNHQGFFFSNNNYTIAWDKMTDCPNRYSLIKSYPNVPDNATYLGSKNSVSLQENELFYQNDSNKIYKLYIRANSSDTDVCGETLTYISLNPEVITTAVFTMPESNVCLDPKTLPVLWPDSTDGRGEDECTCNELPLSSCSCINDTSYSVSENEKGFVCFNDLDAIENNTKVFLVTEFRLYVEKDTVPELIRTYNYSYEIIIMDKPGKPNIVRHSRNIDNNFEIGISLPYNGHNDQLYFIVNITDNAHIGYTFNKYNATLGTTTITTPDEIKGIVDVSCEPLNISVVAVNEIGTSLPSSVKIESRDSDSTYCDCFQNNVHLKVNQINSTRNEIYLAVSCESVYQDVDDIKFTFELQPDRTRKYGYCNSIIFFEGLNSGKTYTTYAIWNQCAIENLGTVYTQKNSIGIKVGIGLGAAFGFIILLFMIGLMLATCIKVFRN